MKHNHTSGTPCATTCPNRAANIARSMEMRCKTHGVIGCPFIGHVWEKAS